jgi:hypothetical protein
MSINTKTLGIYYKRLPNQDGFLYTPENTPANCWWYAHAMQDIVKYLGEKNITVVYLLGTNCYLGQGVFREYWSMDATTGHLTKVAHTIKPDIIYDKGHMGFYDGSFPLFNQPALAQLGRNKWSQYALFQEFQPKSVAVNHPQELPAKIDEIPGDFIVSKPLNKNGGRDIFIGQKANLQIHQYPVLLQEYHETNSGVPGIASKRHYVRLIMFNAKATVAAVRQPEGDKLLANAYQGGSIKFFHPQKLPPALITLAQAIDKKLTGYGNRLYSSDFLLSGAQWYLIEINDRPGLPALQQDEDGAIAEFYQDFYHHVVQWSAHPQRSDDCR